GIDISDDALLVAQRNNEANNTHVQFINADLFDHSTLPTQLFDIIVSNPPYIPQIEKSALDRQVVDFEPHIALFCEDRNSVYGAIVNYAQTHLNKHGKLYLELHHDHPINNENLFDSNYWSYQILNDLGQNRR